MSSRNIITEMRNIFINCELGNTDKIKYIQCISISASSFQILLCSEVRVRVGTIKVLQVRFINSLQLQNVRRI